MSGSGVDPIEWAHALGVRSADELRAYVANLSRYAEQIETDMTRFRTALVNAPDPEVQGRLAHALVLVASAVADLHDARRRLQAPAAERLWDTR